MITSELLIQKGFKEKPFYIVKKRWFKKPLVKEDTRYLRLVKGRIDIVLSLIEPKSDFYYKLNSRGIGILPDDEVFLDKLIEYYS